MHRFYSNSIDTRSPSYLFVFICFTTATKMIFQASRRYLLMSSETHLMKYWYIAWFIETFFLRLEKLTAWLGFQGVTDDPSQWAAPIADLFQTSNNEQGLKAPFQGTLQLFRTNRFMKLSSNKSNDLLILLQPSLLDNGWGRRIRLGY